MWFVYSQSVRSGMLLCDTFPKARAPVGIWFLFVVWPKIKGCAQGMRTCCKSASLETAFYSAVWHYLLCIPCVCSSVLMPHCLCLLDGYDLAWCPLVLTLSHSVSFVITLDNSFLLTTSRTGPSFPPRQPAVGQDGKLASETNYMQWKMYQIWVCC